MTSIVNFVKESYNINLEVTRKVFTVNFPIHCNTFRYILSISAKYTLQSYHKSEYNVDAPTTIKI